MLSVNHLIPILSVGRSEGFCAFSTKNNAFVPGKLYRYEFTKSFDDFVYTDSMNLSTSFSGMEYVFEKSDMDVPVWYCDYSGYVDGKVIGEFEGITAKYMELRAQFLQGIGADFFAPRQLSVDKWTYSSTFTGDLMNLIHLECLTYNGIEALRQTSQCAFMVSPVFARVYKKEEGAVVSKLPRELV